MTTQQYKQAHKMQEEIAKLVYELEVMQQNLDKPTSIRFGTNFNVSIPIEFDLELYTNTIHSQMEIHKTRIETLKEQFAAL